MQTTELFIHCFAEKRGEVWVAMCLEFDLAAQGDSLDEVKQKIEEQIKDYVFDALAGDDREYANQLLSRKAPYRYWLKYWAYNALQKLDGLKSKLSRCSFQEILPLAPQG